MKPSKRSSILARISLVLCVVCCLSLYLVLKGSRKVATSVPSVPVGSGKDLPIAESDVSVISVDLGDFFADASLDEIDFELKYSGKQVDIVGGVLFGVEDTTDGVIVVLKSPSIPSSVFRARMSPSGASSVRAIDIKNGSTRIDITCESVYIDSIGFNCDIFMNR